MTANQRVIEIIIQSFWPMLKAGLVFTIPLTLISFFFGLCIAIFVAIIRVAKIRFLEGFVRFYVWVFRGTPLLVQIFIIFYGLPKVGILLNPFPAAVISFSLNVGAYSSETIRAAILSIPRGQWEAGYSLGMTYVQVLRRIILPQAAKVSIPPLFNTFIGLVKDTSLASTVTLSEMFMTTQRIAAQKYEPLALYIEVAVLYLVFCSFLTWVQKKAELKLSAGQNG